MTVNAKLADIVQRLDRIERLMQRSASNQVVSPCCQQLTDPTTGNPISVIPPTPADVLPEVDEACARMVAHLRRKVDAWNSVVIGQRQVWLWAGVSGLYVALTNALGAWVALHASVAALSQFFALLQEDEDHGFVDDVDYCEAARQAFEDQNVLSVPEAIWQQVNPLDRPVFRLYWTLTGGVQSYENAEPDYSVPLGCCLPETFFLDPVVRSFVCGSFSYDLDVIGDSDPPVVARQVIVNRNGIPHVLRAAISGFWVRSVERPGSFKLEYWYAEAVTNDGCRYLAPRDNGTTPPDGEMNNLQWRLVLPSGSQYIVWRNKAAYEGVRIEVSRNDPGNWDGVSTI